MFSSSADYTRKIKEIELDREGTIITFTKVYEDIENFNRGVPFIVALIKLDNGKKIIGEVVDCKDIKEGGVVEACFRKIYTDEEDGIINYGTKWRLK